MRCAAPHGGAKAVVFLVDDDEDALETLTILLEAENFLVLTARNGKEALTRMKNYTGPAVALVDLLMPEMNGWGLVDAMKTDKNLKSIPIIICSAYPEVPIFGIDYFLQKPVSLAKLTQTLREILELSYEPEVRNESKSG